MLGKNEFIAVLAEVKGCSKKEAGEILDVFEVAVTKAVQEGGVSLKGFLKIETVDVPERTHKNPKDGSEVVKAAHKKVKVKAMKQLADSVN